MPGGLPSMRSHRVGYDWSDLAAAAYFSHLHSLFVLFSPSITIIQEPHTFWVLLSFSTGFPGGASGKELTGQCRTHETGFDP